MKQTVKRVRSEEYVWPCTERDHAIVLSDSRHIPVEQSHDNETTLTVELYGKWYGLILYYPVTGEEGEMYEELDFGVLADYCNPYFSDHCPNPRAVERFAAAKGYYLDPLAYELIVGRWETEVGHYS